MQLKNTKTCIWKFFCLCVYQHNEAFKRRKQCRHRQWLELKHRPLLAMHKCAHFWKSSPRWRPQFPFLFYFVALVSEEPSPQCMCNVCTIRQHIFSSRDGTVPEPLTRDPTRPDPDTFWPGDSTGHWVSVLWIERLFWWRCATSERFLQPMQHTHGWRKFPT